MKNKTTFHRVNKPDNYSVISNDLIKSKELSSDERTILFHLLSLPNDWVIYKTYFQNYYKGNITKGKFDKGWEGLITKGYLKSTKGKIGSWEYEVHEVPVADIPKIEVSEIGIIENTTPHNQVYIQSTKELNTNKQNTNVLSNNVNNSSIILGKKDIKKKNWSDEEIQLDLNIQYFIKTFKNSGVDWRNEINSIPFEEFIQKYTRLTSDTGDDYNLRFNLTNYYKLSGLDNSQHPKG